MLEVGEEGQGRGGRRWWSAVTTEEDLLPVSSPALPLGEVSEVTQGMLLLPLSRSSSDLMTCNGKCSALRE